MASQYRGPTSLTFSKYASPQQKEVQLAALAAVSPIFMPVTESVIATKEQIAASESQFALDLAIKNSDAQLAIAQGNALKKEVAMHTTILSRSVSSAVVNTRQLLGLIRGSLQKVNASELKTVDDLWNELEQLFAAATEAKVALPILMEKQRNNMGLYHSSAVNEIYCETQEELNIQHKKVNLQHDFILEHQQAFQDFSKQAAAKLQETSDLQERVSRLTLEKGNFRTEIDKYKQLLEEEQARMTEVLKKFEDFQKEVEKLLASKEQLTAENEILRAKIIGVEEQKKAEAQAIANRYKAEVKALAEQLVRDGVKTTSFNLLISTLKSNESNTKKETEKLKAENKMLDEKYKNQAVEHASAFTHLNEQTRNTKELTMVLNGIQKENTELKSRLSELLRFEKVNMDLSQAKSDLQKQVNTLSTEMIQSKDDTTRVKNEHKFLLEKFNKIMKDKDDLQIEYNRIKDDNNEILQTIKVLQKENTKLTSIIAQLKTSRPGVAPAVGGTAAAVKETRALEDKIQGLEKNKLDLESALEEWTHLAKRSYKEYKDMLPIYKQAEKLQKEAFEMKEQVNALKLELSAAKSSQSNGVGVGGDAAYWKNRYETLLSTVSA